MTTWAASLSGEPGPELAEFEAAPSDPVPLLIGWFEHAESVGVREPRAVTLATANAVGVPSARVVLLKSVTAGGLLFGTSGASLKGRELAGNPVACINAYWRETMRQVTITGPVAAVPDADSELLFQDRPRGARAVAAASEQSAPLPDPRELERRVDGLLDGDAPIPRPAHWHGYLVIPTIVEFWQGSTDRLHRRLRYEREAPGSAWSSHRLQP